MRGSGVYGVRKVGASASVKGSRWPAAPCGAAHSARRPERRGQGEKKRTTIAGEDAGRPADLVDRNFEAEGPHGLWLADMERYEAFVNRAVVEGHCLVLVAAGTAKLRAA